MTLGYRFQDRRGSYTDTQGQVQSYRPYSLVDSRLAYRLGRALHAYVEANNLFGCRYVDYGNVPQPGQWLMVGVRYSQQLLS